MSGAVTSSAGVFPAGAGERQGLRAGVISRMGAMVIDIVYVAALLGVGYVGVAGFRFLRNPARFTFPQATLPQAAVVGCALAVIVLTISWNGTGRSIGMGLMGLRLLGPGGGNIHAARAFLRAVTCVVFPLGLFWSAISKRNASAHDLLFGTTVVYDWHMRVPPARADDPPPAGDPAAV